MSVALPTTIWGTPMLQDVGRPPSLGLPERATEVPLLRQLHRFLSGQIDSWRPDFIVVAERKGTAIVRALIESKEQPLRWTWDRVISSTALDQLPAGLLTHKRLLVFDDMMKMGRHVQEVLDRLQKLGYYEPGDDHVRAAVFAKHEDSSRSEILDPYKVSQAWFHRDLTTSAFRRIRDRVIRTLQTSGSLMLDTEHLELRMRLQGGFGQLVSALRRRADVVVFRSLGERTNVTVYFEDDEAHELPSHRFPDGTRFASIVKKCRIVERGGNEFAIIPICLPSIAMGPQVWNRTTTDSQILGAGVDKSETARFYGVALLACLYPLYWVLRDLHASDPEAFTLSLPGKEESSQPEEAYSLEHLRVMYPTLNLGCLVDELTEIVKKARSEGARLRKLKVHPRPAKEWSDPNLHKDAMQLLQVIGQVVDERHAKQFHFGMQHASRAGLRASEIFALGKRFGWRPAEISTLFDILIDEANLVTRVEPYNDRGQRRLARTFKPDGEAVTELLRRYTIQWGLPRGF